MEFLPVSGILIVVGIFAAKIGVGRRPIRISVYYCHRVEVSDERVSGPGAAPGQTKRKAAPGRNRL